MSQDCMSERKYKNKLSARRIHDFSKQRRAGGAFRESNLDRLPKNINYSCNGTGAALACRLGGFSRDLFNYISESNCFTAAAEEMHFVFTIPRLGTNVAEKRKNIRCKSKAAGLRWWLREFTPGHATKRLFVAPINVYVN